MTNFQSKIFNNFQINAIVFRKNSTWLIFTAAYFNELKPKNALFRQFKWENLQNFSTPKLNTYRQLEQSRSKREVMSKPCNDFTFAHCDGAASTNLCSTHLTVLFLSTQRFFCVLLWRPFERIQIYVGLKWNWRFCIIIQMNC